MANPDLQIRGGPGHLDPEIEEGGKGARKIFVWPFGPQFGLKMERGGGKALLGPLPWIHHLIN